MTECSPTATTNMDPVPWHTLVPDTMMGWSVGFFSKGVGSPVRADSSMFSLSAVITKPSTPTIMPSDSSTTSPTTMSGAGICSCLGVPLLLVRVTVTSVVSSSFCLSAANCRPFT